MAIRGATSIIWMLVVVVVAQAQPTGRPMTKAAAPDIILSQQRGCGPGPHLSPNMQDCVLDEFMSSNGSLAVGFSVNPKATGKHGLLVTLRSVGGAAVM